MSKLMLRREGKPPVEISEEDFDRAMAERIFRHWQETRSELIVNRGEQQFVVVPKNKIPSRPVNKSSEPEIA
jgi:hypothetical protein